MCIDGKEVRDVDEKKRREIGDAYLLYIAVIKDRDTHKTAYEYASRAGFP